MATDALTRRAVTQSVDLRHWRVVFHRLRAVYRTPDYPTGAELVARIAHAAQLADHHPDITVRYGDVQVTLHSHDVGGLSQRDVDLAATIAGLADALGVQPRPELARAVEVAVDAVDIPQVRRFWAAALAYDEVGDDELVDPTGAGPTFWFQQMDEPRHERNRLHLDVGVPHDGLSERLAATLAAGGRLLDDGAAPAFWVLADPEGNEACLCTWRGRDEDDRDAAPDAATF